MIAAWYVGLTAIALASAYAGRGLRRSTGALIVCVYAIFVGSLLATAYG